MLYAGFHELFLRNDPESFDRLRAQCGASPQSDEERIVAYLGADLDFEAVGVVLPDRIGGGYLPSSWALLSDGTWIWSNALQYYVRYHHFRVPADFANHMAAQSWRPPRREEVDWEQVFQTDKRD